MYDYDHEFTLENYYKQREYMVQHLNEMRKKLENLNRIITEMEKEQKNET